MYVQNVHEHAGSQGGTYNIPREEVPIFPKSK